MAALTPPPRPPTDPVPQLRRAMLLRGGAACAGLDDGTCLVLTPDGRGLTVVAAADDGNEAVARHATRYCLSRYRPACAKLLGLRNALGDHAPFVAKRLMERAAPHARRGPRMARWRPEDGCWRADGGHASCEGDAFGASALLKYVHDAPAEDEFDSHTRVASEKLLRPASSSLAACVCQGTEVDLPLVEALPTPSPESDDGPSLDPRQLLAILGGDGAYFADVLCDVECGAGFTLTRLGDRVEARLHPGAAFDAEAAFHADALIVLRGRDCALRRRGADDVDASASTSVRSTSSARSRPPRCGPSRRSSCRASTPAPRRPFYKVAAAGCSASRRSTISSSRSRRREHRTDSTRT